MSRNQYVIPEASGGIDRLKYEVAREVGVDLKEGYNGDLLSRQAGLVGGNMVKRMVEAYERSIAGIER